MSGSFPEALEDEALEDESFVDEGLNEESAPAESSRPGLPFDSLADEDSRNRFKSSAMSRAVEYRLLIRFDNAFRQIRSSSGCKSPSYCRKGRGRAVMTFCITCDLLVPPNGRRPVSNSYNTVPRLKMSLRPST